MDSVNRREIVMWVLVAALFAAVMLTAWLSLPEFTPAAVVYRDAASTAAATAPSGDRLDLNTATLEQLAALPQLGEQTAADIVAYRDLYGDFDSVDELANVEGVGEKKLAMWKQYLTVS